ncbi:hypothetical protein CAPTEDRAFT_216298 [Capitella teleta]|uniref:Uncharacterized protein n=1 Tax=Capitella teleta TaxID=283909 RepID=R7UC04_CAPTE|nr:hypothetical protein CAPTEDRAFT_216298 [Capitella teleta]|eukprot:ELU03900.1 hypothetical protein CAPTEDRAFT_216298 [Capitella teleta]
MACASVGLSNPFLVEAQIEMFLDQFKYAAVLQAPELGSFDQGIDLRPRTLLQRPSRRMDSSFSSAFSAATVTSYEPASMTSSVFSAVGMATPSSITSLDLESSFQMLDTPPPRVASGKGSIAISLEIRTDTCTCEHFIGSYIIPYKAQPLSAYSRNTVYPIDLEPAREESMQPTSPISAAWRREILRPHPT